MASGTTLAILAVLTVPSGANGATPSDQIRPDLDVRVTGASAAPASSGKSDLAAERHALERGLGPAGFAEPAPGPIAATDFVGRTDGYLSARSEDSATSVVLDYVRSERDAFGLDKKDINDLELTNAYTSWEGVRHLSFAQIVDGFPSYDTSLNANVTEDGRLINVSGGPVGDLVLDDPDPRLSAEQALIAARDNVGGTESPRFGALESARLVAFVHGPGAAELAWEVYADTPEGLLYEVVVGADSGRILVRRSRTNFVNQADVWNLHPDQQVTPTRVDLGADPSWIDDTAGGTKLRGNNAHAYADVNANNTADPTEEVAQVGGDWLFPVTFFTHAECPAFGCTWDSADNSTKATNKNAATTGLFYLVNRFHDHLLEPPIAFDEASGNFEQVNASGQGLGGDRVQAEANDGGALNNATFSTPRDGAPGRMSQHFFANTWDVNSSDDADIVYHEYAHGLTNRLVGNGGGLNAFQSRAMGEGFSDWFALDFLVASGEKLDGPGADLQFGNYVTDYSTGSGGIRNQRIDCDPGVISTACAAIGTTGPGGFTFGDLGKFCCGGGGVHDNGEIWSQTLWDLREALGPHDARAVIAGGLRLAPPDPSFLRMRDAILQSALTLGVSRPKVWEVFANRGIGFSAASPGPSATAATQAFDLPAALTHIDTEVLDDSLFGDEDGYAEPGETLLITTALDKQFEPPLSGVTGKLKTTESALLLGTADTSWADFPAGGAAPAVNSPALSATIPEDFACEGELELSIEVDSSDGPVSVPTQRLSVGSPTFRTEEPNLVIPDNNAAGVNTGITLPAGAGVIADMDVTIGELTHTYPADLRLLLTSPLGTTVVLADGAGAAAPGFADLVFDDEADLPVHLLPAGNKPLSGRARPVSPLSAFDGQAAAGTWTLNVNDRGAGDTGTLKDWGLKDGTDCSTTAPSLPTAVTRDPVAVGATAATVAAEIDPRGTATSFAFEYGTDQSYGRRTTPQPLGSTSSATGTAVIPGLAEQTIYHYRALALRHGVVIARGSDRFLRTLALSCETARADAAQTQSRLEASEAARVAAERRSDEAEAALAAAEQQLAGAEKRLAKAKKKLKRARASGDAPAIKKAKQRARRAKQAARQTGAAAGVAAGRAAAAAAELKHAEADEATARTDAAGARAAVNAHCP